MHLLWFHGIAAGWLVGRLMKGGGYGLVGGLIIGVIGAFLGGWPLGPLGIVAGGLIGSPVTADHWAVVFAVSDPADQEGVASPSRRVQPAARPVTPNIIGVPAPKKG
jgi:uncharacterized membrane protein YeaQ/YmgE (transglycosylase-associated protein family)